MESHVHIARPGRRDALRVAAAAALAATIGPARAEGGVSLKIGHALPPTHPITARAAEVAAAITARSGGRVKVQSFGSSMLGGDLDMLSQVRSGAIDFYMPTPMSLSTLVPMAAISGVPFSFRNYDEVWKAMDGGLGDVVRASVGKAGLEVVGAYWDTGFRHFVSGSRVINTPQDMAGFKIRVPPSPLQVSMFKALGASPASISFGEVYQALQTGIVDGMENNLVIIDTTKAYEVQKHLALVSYMWDGVIVVANPRSLAKLSAADRELVKTAFDDGAQNERAEVVRLEAQILDSLQKRGLVVNRPEREPFKQALLKTDFYATWKAKFGNEAWAVREKYVDQLA